MRMIKSFFEVVKLPAILVLAFFALYILKRWTFPNPVVFYEGAFVGIFVFCFALIYCLHLYRTKRVELFRKWLSAALIQVLFSYSFIITFPALLDRSISLFIIASIAKIERPLEREVLVQHFKNGYVDKSFTVDKRLDEQLVSGNVEYIDDKIMITDRGRRLYRLNIFLASLFNISKKYVDPNVDNLK